MLDGLFFFNRALFFCGSERILFVSPVFVLTVYSVSLFVLLLANAGALYNRQCVLELLLVGNTVQMVGR